MPSLGSQLAKLGAPRDHVDLKNINDFHSTGFDEDF
jgi:hypothetical protein